MKTIIKIVPIFVLVAIIVTMATMSNADAGTIKAYYVIHDGKIENLIRLDSDLVSTWFIDDSSRVLVLVTRTNVGKIGDAYDETKDDDDVRRFISPTAEPIRRIEVLKQKILSNTDTYDEFREFIILELNITE